MNKKNNKKSPRTRHWSYKLKRMGACKEALAWAAKQPDYKTAWEKCKRVDWLDWLVIEAVDIYMDWDTYEPYLDRNDYKGYKLAAKRPSLERWK